MKRAFLIVLCVFLLASFSFNVAAVQVHTVSFPEPDINDPAVDGYFLTPSTLRIYDVIPFVTSLSGGNYSSTSFASQETVSYFLYYTAEHMVASSAVEYKVYVLNLSPSESLAVERFIVNLSANYIMSYSGVTVPSMSSSSSPVLIDSFTISDSSLSSYGLYYKGVILDNSSLPSGSTNGVYYEYEANVVWGSDALILNKITALNNYLSSDIIPTLASILSDLGFVNSGVQSIQAYFQNFMETYIPDIVSQLNNISTEVELGNLFHMHADLEFIANYLRGWIFDTYPDDFAALTAQLDQIIDILSGEEESVTIEDDTQAYEDMQSARDALQVTDANGQPVDAARQVEVAFSEAASGIGDLSVGVGSINSMITQLLSLNPLVIVPIIVALALGLVVTILGKNKSD